MTAKVRIENGLVTGTSGDKYESKNPLARWMVARFDRAVSDLARQTAAKTILEVGCGEGHIVGLMLKATDARIHATDISAACVAEASANINSDRVTFAVHNLMTLHEVEEPPDLVVCCEVLEHLTDPIGGIERLMALRAKAYLFSVPQEPLWRILNFCRGAYVREWGNSPGHVQHWSTRGFLRFVAPWLEPISVRHPPPWTVVLAKPRGPSVSAFGERQNTSGSGSQP